MLAGGCAPWLPWLLQLWLSWLAWLLWLSWLAWSSFELPAKEKEKKTIVMRTRFLLAAVRFVAILFAVSAACVPMSPKCHRTTFVKDGEGITGTLFRNWVDLDCTDSVAEVYCTDTTMRMCLLAAVPAWLSLCLSPLLPSFVAAALFLFLFLSFFLFLSLSLCCAISLPLSRCIVASLFAFSSWRCIFLRCFLPCSAIAVHMFLVHAL